MASGDALPIPRKNVAFRLTFPIQKSDGTRITAATGLDSEVSKDQAAFNDCTNEAIEISQGVYYLDITSTEMNADCVSVVVKTTSAGAIDTTFVLYPMEDVDIRSNVIDWNSSAVNSLVNGKVDSVNVLVTGTASAGAAQSITLAGASAVDNIYKYQAVEILSGTGSGQTRIILDYVGSTKVATVNKAWTTQPDNTSVFAIIPSWAVDIVHSGIAQGGGASTITLQSTASSSDDIYKGQIVFVTGGTGNFQTRVITAYNGTTKVATVAEAWVTNPDSTSIYQLMAQGRSLVDVIKSGIIASTTFASGALDAVWSTASRTLTAFSDSSGVTTLLARLTSTRAGLLDNLDAAITGIPTTVWANATRTLTAISDSTGITTLLSRIASALTITSGKVDVNNVATIQSGLATSTDVTNATSPLLTTSHFDASVVDVDLTPVLDQLDIIEAKTNLITIGGFEISSPRIPDTNDLELVYANDYTVASGNPIPPFENDDWTVFDLTSADSVTLKTKTVGKVYSLVKDVTVNSDTSITVEFTHDELTNFEITKSIAQVTDYVDAEQGSPHTFTVQAILADGTTRETLIQGQLFIIEDVP